MNQRRATERRILIVEWDAGQADPLWERLLEAGYVVRVATDLAEMNAILRDRPPELAILDWDLPGHAAPEFLRRLVFARTPERIGVIVTSAGHAEADVVAALELGADDFLARPYSTRELVARIHAVLRARDRRSELQTVTQGEISIDARTDRASAKGTPLLLRAAEYRLLDLLVRNPDRIFDRGQLRRRIWGEASDIEERTVDVTVQRLRKVLADSGCRPCIQTVRGFGYRFAQDVRDALDPKSG